MMLKLLISALILFAFSGCVTKSVNYVETSAKAKQNNQTELDEFSSNMHKTIGELDDFKYSVNKTSRTKDEDAQYNSFESFILNQTKGR